MSKSMTGRVRRPALFLIVLALVLGAAGVAWAAGPAPKSQAERFEVAWMKMMIDHHQMAVMMAELAVEQAAHTELQELAADIIATQSHEIQLMQGWLAAWYGIAYEPQMSAADMEMMAHLEELAGAEFEIAWMQEMIHHHMMAIMEARQLVARAYHPELKDLGRQIITDQRAEIRQMREWLYEWYGIRGMGGAMRGGMGGAMRGMGGGMMETKHGGMNGDGTSPGMGRMH
jgi:uncharacterized protein (DUF305 family)